jgi:hypothetical protein
MKDYYHIDTETYSLQKFKSDIGARDLIPSRVSLKDELDERFEILQNNGLTNLKELIDALKTKAKIADFSEKTGLPVEYLTLLRREANSYLPNPVRIDTFSGIPSEYVDRLAVEGMNNTRQLFNAAIEKSERVQISQRTGIPMDILTEAVCLSDLVRAYGIGPVFARMLYDVGIKSIKDFVGQSAEELINIYEVKEQKKADFGINELQFSIDLAMSLDIAVEI